MSKACSLKLLRRVSTWGLLAASANVGATRVASARAALLSFVAWVMEKILVMIGSGGARAAPYEDTRRGQAAEQHGPGRWLGDSGRYAQPGIHIHRDRHVCVGEIGVGQGEGGHVVRRLPVCPARNEFVVDAIEGAVAENHPREGRNTRFRFGNVVR